MRKLTGTPNRRILVVDDDPSIHEDLRSILCAGGPADRNPGNEATQTDGAYRPCSETPYQVDSACGGQEALEKLREGIDNGQPYAVAFVDMCLAAGGEAPETIARFWRDDPRLEIVACTTRFDDSWLEIVTQAGRCGQFLILRKPFEPAEVAQLAAGLTEKWDLARRAEVRVDQLEQSVTERTVDLEQSRRETEALLASISSLLIGVNEFGIVHRWNKSAEEVLGISSSEALGSQLSELEIEWTDPEEAYQFFNDHKSGAITRRALKLVRNGSIRVLGASSYPVTDNGMDRGFLCLGSDITDHRQLEQQLQQAQKLEAVGQLAAGVAHEINTPMQYLGDNLEFLQNKMGKLRPVVDNIDKLLDVADQAEGEDEFLSEMRATLKKVKLKTFLQQVSEAIDDSRDGVHHVSRIVRAMKEFAHPGQEEKTPVDINRSLESTIAVSTNEWKYVAAIETDFDTSIPTVQALAGELNQVFLNILVNAAHAISDATNEGATGKGTITIATRSMGEFVEVSIADSGTGIPDDVKQRIFDPFFTTKEIGKGTGQGLAIAHSVVVQKHGGTLRCESSAGVGTTFFIQIPVGTCDVETQDELESAAV